MSALDLPDPDSITRRVRAPHPDAVRVSRGEVLAVTAMTKTLGDLAAEYGGEHVRALAENYLTANAGPWLNGRYTERTGRELFAAASQLAHLCGWMNQDAGSDDGHQGRAQRYYAYAYALACDADEPEPAATAVRGLAVQALDLGPRGRAVALRLSERCVELAERVPEPKANAYYQTTFADAAALDGDRRRAMSALAASQTAIERADQEPGESWASHFSLGRWAHHSGMVLGRLGDLDGAREHLQRALDVHGLDRRRSRAIVLGDLGTVHLRQGDVDGACATWTEFLDCADTVRSVKVDDAVDAMRARLDRHQDVPAARELGARAAALRGRA